MAALQSNNFTNRRTDGSFSGVLHVGEFDDEKRDPSVTDADLAVSLTARRDALIAALTDAVERNVHDLNTSLKKKDPLVFTNQTGAVQTSIEALDNEIRVLMDAVEEAERGSPTPSDPSYHPVVRLLQQRLHERDMKISALSADLEALRLYYTRTMSEAVTAVTEEMRMLKDAGSQAEEQCRRSRERLEEEVAVKESRISHLEERLASTIKAIDTEREEWKTKNSRLEAQLAAALRNLERRREETLQLKNRAERAESEVAQLKVELVHTLRAASTEEALREELDTALAKCAGFEAQLADFATKKNRTEQLLSAERETVEALRKELESSQQRVTDLETRNARLHHDVARQKVDLGLARNEITRLTQERDQAYALSRGFEKAKLELEQANAALLIRESVRRRNEAAPPNAVISAYESRLSALTLAKDIQLREATALRKQVAAVTSELEAARAELLELRNGVVSGGASHCSEDSPACASEQRKKKLSAGIARLRRRPHHSDSELPVDS